MAEPIDCADGALGSKELQLKSSVLDSEEKYMAFVFELLQSCMHQYFHRNGFLAFFY